MSSGKVRETDLSNYFQVESHLIEGLFADAYKAIDKSSTRAVCLWMFRSRLKDQVGADDAFLERISLLSAELSGSVLRFGVDSSGVAFATVPTLDGRPLIGGGIDVVEAERRFLACLRLVAGLHDKGIALGDVTENSFWVDRSGAVRLIGVLGDFSEFFVEKEEAKNPEYVFHGSQFEKDCYALSVIAVRLFTGAFPDGKVAVTAKGAPVWVHSVLQAGIEGKYKVASEILKDIQDARKRVVDEAYMPATPKIGGLTKIAPRESQLILGPSVKHKEEQTEVVQGSSASTALITVAIGALCALGVGGFLYWSSGEKAMVEGAALPVVSQGTEVIDETELRKLSQSDDPVAHEQLIEKAIAAVDRARPEFYLLERARRRGSLRAAEQVRRWLREPNQKIYRDVLRLLDPGAPKAIQSDLLKGVYSEDKNLGIGLAAALFLDGSFDEVLLRSMIGDSLPGLETKTLGSSALILAHPNLSVEFGEDVIQKKESLTDADLLELLKILSIRNDSFLRPVAHAALERGLIDKRRSLLLETVRDRADLPPHISQTLALSALSDTDISSLGGWKDRDLEKILLAISGSFSDKVKLKTVMDFLGATTVSSEPASSLMRWLRESSWENRANFAPLIGALSSPERFTKSQLDDVFKSVESYVNDKKLVAILVQSDAAALTMIRKYPSLIGVPRALTLLRNSDPEVRLGAIEVLKGTNDLGAMKVIINAFESEKEPSVKSKYRDTFWFVKDRK